MAIKPLRGGHALKPQTIDLIGHNEVLAQTTLDKIRKNDGKWLHSWVHDTKRRLVYYWAFRGHWLNRRTHTEQLGNMESVFQHVHETRLISKVCTVDTWLDWYVSAFVTHDDAREAIQAAIKRSREPNPEFDFMPAVAVGPRRKRTRKAETSEHPFAIQLELATALVEIVRTLDEKPKAATLADARRKVSALHQSLHAEATFKQAAQG